MMIILSVYLPYITGVVRWADGAKLDDLPAGHLINPRVGDIKSRHILPAHNKPSGKHVFYMTKYNHSLHVTTISYIERSIAHKQVYVHRVT